MRPQTLPDVQVLLGDPKLTKSLTWEQKGSRVIATPRRRLPRTTFQRILKAFQRMGGHYEPYVGFTVELSEG